MGKLLSSFFIFFLNFQLSCSWPGMKNKNGAENYHDHRKYKETDTANCHTNCCSGHRIDNEISRPSNVKWPSQFSMKWEFYFGQYCSFDTDPECRELISKSLKGNPNFNVTRGTTYFNENYRGGALRGEYKDRCLNIWKKFDGDWPCDFYMIKEEEKSFQYNHGNLPDGMPRCCIVGNSFSPPPSNFTNLMNFNGTKTNGDGKEYLSFGLFVEGSGGPFEYSFWNNPKKFNEQIYYDPAFFTMLGITPDGQNLMVQQFEEINPSVPDEKLFKIPEECKKPNLPFCPEGETELISNFNFKSFLKN